MSTYKEAATTGITLFQFAQSRKSGPGIAAGCVVAIICFWVTPEDIQWKLAVAIFALFVTALLVWSITFWLFPRTSNQKLVDEVNGIKELDNADDATKEFLISVAKHRFASESGAEGKEAIHLLKLAQEDVNAMVDEILRDANEKVQELTAEVIASYRSDLSSRVVGDFNTLMKRNRKGIRKYISNQINSYLKKKTEELHGDLSATLKSQIEQAARDTT